MRIVQDMLYKASSQTFMINEYCEKNQEMEFIFKLIVSILLERISIIKMLFNYYCIISLIKIETFIINDNCDLMILF